MYQKLSSEQILLLRYYNIYWEFAVDRCCVLLGLSAMPLLIAGSAPRPEGLLVELKTTGSSNYKGNFHGSYTGLMAFGPYI